MSSKTERFHTAIKENGGYEEISQKTGISVSTLVRIAKGKSEPKLKDAVAIAEATNTSLNYIVYGEEKDGILDKSAEELLKVFVKISDKIAKDKTKAEDK
ncbi:helix-turn-helix domain-containing protein [Vibrio furnissii]|uniref:helix-turn-helix domain-containing protein n=1 Tax=Vibrio furnissii TaxID=29494 RepID=UPI001C9DBA7F|nr:helix-turn-helix transcriptional regulator [Vibrio furnissii]MBY7781098.1 helix-turn-helix domain-containing protein [Vibrio fluvialis]MBY7814392.1 helix-turn-helix domain-containing protein [Vibrio fluvialis]UHJ61624.1 helix-turn-helix domain-containing protein [Vibrio furnissii]UHJ61628.1 helix-turn-helix domain-containing protein [Vibrio furnissii]